MKENINENHCHMLLFLFQQNSIFKNIKKKKQNWRESSGGPKIRTQGFHSSILDSIPDWGSKIPQASVMSKIKGKKKKLNEKWIL